jgi:hypothetical protein
LSSRASLDILEKVKFHGICLESNHGLSFVHSMGIIKIKRIFKICPANITAKRFQSGKLELNTGK